MFVTIQTKIYKKKIKQNQHSVVNIIDKC